MKILIICTVISALLLSGCMQQPANSTSSTNPQSGDAAFKKVHDEYVVEFLRRNPTVNTYLGGAGLDPKLRNVDSALRDHSASALQEEDRWLTTTKQSLETI